MSRRVSELEQAMARHNAYAPSIVAMVIAAGHDRADDSFIILESVVVGVLWHFFEGNHQGAAETLDLITEGALRRLK
jgi:hypothetical protein